MPVFKQDGGSNKQWGEVSTSGRTWLFATTEIPVNTVMCRFDPLSFRMFEEGEADNTGEVQLVFEELDYLAAQLDEVSAVIDASMLEPTASWTGTIVGITADLELNFVEPILGMQAGLGVSCTFEPFEIILKENGYILLKLSIGLNGMCKFGLQCCYILGGSVDSFVGRCTGLAQKF